MKLSFRNFKYYMHEATENIFKNSLMTLASFATVTCCLVLLGIFMLFSVNVNFLGKQIQSQCEIQAFIEADLNEEEQQKIFNKVKALENVEKAEFESREEAWKNYCEYLGADAEAFYDLDGNEIMRSSVKISMKDLSLAEELTKEVASISGVATVKNRQDLVNKIMTITKVVKVASLIAMLVLLLIAMFIISNTIKMSVHSREDAIHIMRYVGATDSFIRWPFIIEGLIVGFISGIFSLCLIFLGYDGVVSWIKDTLDVFTLKNASELVLPIGITVVCFGIFMGTVGSMLSIKKHLKV